MNHSADWTQEQWLTIMLLRPTLPLACNDKPAPNLMCITKA